MEDYEEFVQHRLSGLRKSEQDGKASTPTTSLIRFYGKPILPPLLSGEQREEMQRHKNEAKNAGDHRRLKADSRMAHVQTILQSVQLRKTPTLEELFHESGFNTKFSYYSTSSRSVSQSDFVTGTKDNVTFSLPPDMSDGKNGVCFPLLTSTTCSTFFTSHVTPQLGYQDGCLIDQHEGKQGSHPETISLNGASHQPLSSGYMPYKNVENTTILHGRIETADDSYGFGSLDESDSTSGFFLHNTSNTIAKMPDIISHPPINGEELERSGLESFFCENIIAPHPVKDVSYTSPQQGSVKCSQFPIGKSELCDDSPAFTAELCKDQNRDTNEGPVLESTDFSENPEFSQTLTMDHCSTTDQLHFHHGPGETEEDNQEGKADLKASEEPYQLSLQALLKKSREYLRHQRTLKNQAKNSKIQERNQEKPRCKEEEQSLSDKENDEFFYKGTVTTDGKKTRERSGTFSLETSPKSCENEEEILREGVIKEDNTMKENLTSESTHLTGDNNAMVMTRVAGESAPQNNFSQEFIMEPKGRADFPKQPSVILTESSSVQEAFCLTSEQNTTCPISIFKGVRKYPTILAPHFCMSPIRCTSNGTIKDGNAVDEAEIPNGKTLINTSLNVSDKVEAEGNVEHQHGKAVSPIVNLVGEGELTRVLAKSSQHIDQLESNLSSLKVLISTLTENSDNHSQTQNNPQINCCSKGLQHCDQFKKAQYGQNDWEINFDSHYIEQDQRVRIQSNNYKNMHGDTGPEPSISNINNIPVTVQERGIGGGHLKEAKHAKTLTTEREKGKGLLKGGQSKTCGQHAYMKQQSPPKCFLSQTQQMRIPDVFRTFPSETTVPCESSVLSDTSNQLVDRWSEGTVEEKDSTQSLSLNHSYDVDTPSGLWDLEGLRGNLGSKGHHVQEKELTPESWSEGHGGVSKVKRRLLMHVTDDAKEKGGDTRAGFVIRSNSSAPRAAVRWYEGHGGLKDKQQQMKLAHAAQVRALQDEHRRQQEELLQALSVHYHLQNVSFPCPTSGSSLGDTLTFPPSQSQPSSSLSECYRPLVLAAVKGFLTRRLMRTEKVAQLRRTMKDTQQFLQALQQQSPDREEICIKQDLLLQERVTLQLRAARYELYDIFFSQSAGERMQIISRDRELARERELRRQSEHTGGPRGKNSLSAATQKSLERKRDAMVQKKAAERHKGVLMRAGHKTGLSADQPLKTKWKQFRTNSQRVNTSPMNTSSSRPW